MSQNRNHLNHCDLRVQVPRRVRAEVPQAAVWANQAGPGHSIPPKYSVAEVSSIWIAQNVERKLRNFLGHKFWARGSFRPSGGTRGRSAPTSKIRRSRTKQLNQLQLKLASS